MKNSWKLGSLAGIEIFVHWSFAALIGWVALSYLSGGGLLSAAFGICFLLAVFGCVFLHELGHALGWMHTEQIGHLMHEKLIHGGWGDAGLKKP